MHMGYNPLYILFYSLYKNTAVRDRIWKCTDTDCLQTECTLSARTFQFTGTIY